MIGGVTLNPVWGRIMSSVFCRGCGAAAPDGGRCGHCRLSDPGGSNVTNAGMLFTVVAIVAVVIGVAVYTASMHVNCRSLGSPSKPQSRAARIPSAFAWIVYTF